MPPRKENTKDLARFDKIHQETVKPLQRNDGHTTPHKLAKLFTHGLRPLATVVVAVIVVVIPIVVVVVIVVVAAVVVIWDFGEHGVLIGFGEYDMFLGVGDHDVLFCFGEHLHAN